MFLHRMLQCLLLLQSTPRGAAGHGRVHGRAGFAAGPLKATACLHCRRNGKPTSLGCFDHEEQAARAYDKMMLWCELHNTSGVKGGGITNFDPTEYEKDLVWLQTISQARAQPLVALQLPPWKAIHAHEQGDCR